jgi:predicted MFS family arabinose efflux permease
MIRRLSPFLPWLVWLTPVLFFGFQFILRLFPGNVQSELMQHFQVDATSFGVFASAYYVGYAGMQIPVALLIEKIGPKFMMAGSALLCAVACWMMVWADSWPLAIFSRFLIGVGSVVGFLGTTKIIHDWFAPEHHAKMIGLSFSLGLIGAVYGGKPVTLMVQQTNWQEVLMYLGLVAGAIAVLAMIFVKIPKKPLSSNVDNRAKKSSLKQDLITLFSSKSLLILAIANFLMVGSLEGFADVWGVNYLVMTLGVAKSEASYLTSYIFMGMILGAPLLSYLADKTHSHVTMTGLCGMIMAVLMGSLILFFNHFNLLGVKLVLFSVGMLSTYQVLVFVVGERLVPKYLSNIAIATLNCINMFGGSFFHSTIGLLIDFFWNGNIDATGQPIYDIKAYSTGLLIIPITALMGGALVAFIKNKK